MTVKKLKEYRSICKEIEEKTIELKNRTLFDTVTGSDKNFPYTQHTVKVTGAEYTPGNERLLNQLSKLRMDKEEIERFIDNIPDSITRRIFEYRYIKGSYKPSWVYVAMKINKSVEAVRKIHERYIKTH